MDCDFLARQKARIKRRIARYEALPRDPDHERAAYAAHKYQNILPKLREALRRIEEGKYGICARCGNDIPRERLQLIPGALTCSTCPHTVRGPRINLTAHYHSQLFAKLTEHKIAARLREFDPVTREELFPVWRDTIRDIMWNEAEQEKFLGLPRDEQETYFPKKSSFSFHQLCENISHGLRGGGGIH